MVIYVMAAADDTSSVVVNPARLSSPVAAGSIERFKIMDALKWDQDGMVSTDEMS